MFTIDIHFAVLCCNIKSNLSNVTMLICKNINKNKCKKKQEKLKPPTWTRVKKNQEVWLCASKFIIANGSRHEGIICTACTRDWWSTLPLEHICSPFRHRNCSSSINDMKILTIIAHTKTSSNSNPSKNSGYFRLSGSVISSCVIQELITLPDNLK